ncbi:MAG: hypothetical protein K6F46_00545 [Desulfovibrio sp.]|nr:hypothetical protein [Desulfovibrio sp.]
MATAISRYIKLKNPQNNADYARKLFAYISAPERTPLPEDGNEPDPVEKCAALIVIGSSEQDDIIITDKEEIKRGSQAAADEAAGLSGDLAAFAADINWLWII